MSTRSQNPDIEKIVYILALLGSIIAILEAAIGLSHINLPNLDYNLVAYIVAIIIAILALFSTLKPNDPIPYHWIVLFIFSILLIILGSIIGGIMILIAAILALLAENKVI
ncbi:MAG: hypothetical protein JXA99_15820 [Candidatus Lokiarchaeota archaeon]|nr:hypothetical protein [Candidatus Lokiarchaeota archaeon]